MREWVSKGKRSDYEVVDCKVGGTETRTRKGVAARERVRRGSKSSTSFVRVWNALFEVICSNGGSMVDCRSRSAGRSASSSKLTDQCTMSIRPSMNMYSPL
jgi:hypothetical protein